MEFLGKGEMFTKRVVNKFVHKYETLFVCIVQFRDLSFQLMKHGTKTLHVAFIFFCSV